MAIREPLHRESRPAHRLDIQGLRGIAVLLVVLYHAGLWVDGGFIGVDIFFVISGFVITAMLLRETERTGTVDLRQFYARRARRLMPALAVMSSTVLVVSVLVSSPFGNQQVASATAVAASLFAANFHLFRAGGGYFDPSEAANPFLHTWSLSVEEQFYFLLPIVIFACWRLAFRSGSSPRARSMTLLAVGVVSIVSFVLSVTMVSDVGPSIVGDQIRWAFYSPVTRCWEFGVGSMLALAVTGRREWPDGSRAVSEYLGVLLIGAASLMFDSGTAFPGLAAAVPVLGTTLLLAATRESGPVGVILGSRPLVWIGDRSYSWYLWHWPAIVWAGTLWPGQWTALPLAAAASILPAELSYRFVEMPIRHHPSITGRRLGLLAAACVMVPVGLGLAVRAGSARHWGIELPVEFAERSSARSAGCHSDGPLESFSYENCYFEQPASKGTVLVLGDSHGASVADAVVAASADAGYSTAVWTRSGCPFIDEPTGDRECLEWRRSAAELADALQPEIVFVANRSMTFTDPGRAADAEMALLASADRAELWEVGMTTALDSLPVPSDVVLMRTVPDYSAAGEDSFSLLRPHGVAQSMELEAVERKRADMVSAEESVLASHPSVNAFDPVRWLCPTACSQRLDGEWLYYDTNHLTTRGADRLVTPLADLFEMLRDAPDD